MTRTVRSIKTSLLIVDLKVRPIESMVAGESVSFSACMNEDRHEGFTSMSGDENPVHLSDAVAQELGYKGRLIHGLNTASEISKGLGMDLPGHGAIFTSLFLVFCGPVYVGDIITTSLTVKRVILARRRVIVDGIIRNQDGAVVMKARATIKLPKPKAKLNS